MCGVGRMGGKVDLIGIFRVGSSGGKFDVSACFGFVS